MRSLLFLLACWSVQAAGPGLFIQLADPQLGMFAKNANTLQEEANLRFVVAGVNRLRPAFVVVCGDLVNQTGDPVQIARYLDIMHTVDAAIPVYAVAGNHDIGNEPTAASLAAYRKAFGRDYYTFDSGDIRGIVLNSSLIAVPKNVPEEAARQEAWLLAELQRARRDGVAHIIVFQHIPYFIETSGEPDQYFNITTATRRKYLAWFHEYGVKQVFAGHYHRNAYGRDGDLEMITNGPVGVPLGKDQSGLRVVRIAGPTVEHRYYEFGSIPNAILPAEPLPAFPSTR